MAFPIEYEADYVEERSRLTTFFRGIMVFPLMIVGFFYGLGALFALVAAWFAVVFTGKYPPGLYNFISSVLRWGTRVNAYYLLATDAYPPFNLDVDNSYPIRLKIAPAKGQYNRLTAFFRGITAIPSQIVSSVLSLIAMVGAIGAWFTIVFTGKTTPGLQKLINWGISYQAKALGYYHLLHEEWMPPIEEDANSGGTLPPGGAPAKAPAAKKSAAK